MTALELAELTVLLLYSSFTARGRIDFDKVVHVILTNVYPLPPPVTNCHKSATPAIP